MKFLFVYYTHKPGGLCKRLYRLMLALSERGHEVHYLTLDRPPVALPVSVHRIPFPMTKRKGLVFWILFTALLPVVVLWKALSLKPDKFVTFSSYYSCAVAIASLWCRAPIMLFLRSVSFTVNRLTEKPLPVLLTADLIDKLGVRAASHIICMTQAMRTEVQHHTSLEGKTVSVLPNDLPEVMGGQRKEGFEYPLRVLAAGVLDQRKNISLLIRAAKEVRMRNGADVLSVAVAGDGPMRERLELEGSGEVEFLGWLSDLAGELASFDLLVHPSLHEGVSNVLMEALVQGLPVLASDVPEHRELLGADELLFSSENHHELVARLEGIVKNPHVIKLLRAESQKVAERYRFDWDARATELCLSSDN